MFTLAEEASWLLPTKRPILLLRSGCRQKGKISDSTRISSPEMSVMWWQDARIGGMVDIGAAALGKLIVARGEGESVETGGVE